MLRYKFKARRPALNWKRIGISTALSSLSVVGILFVTFGANLLVLQTVFAGSIGIRLRTAAFEFLAIGATLWGIFAYALVSYIAKEKGGQ